jgi:hypothetical protein
LNLKIQKIITLLLAIPLCAGLFGGVVEAAEGDCEKFAKDSAEYKVDCKTEELCEQELTRLEEEEMKPCDAEIEALQKNIDDIVDSVDMMGELPELRENIGKMRGEMLQVYKNKIIPLKVKVQSFRNVDVKNILKIDNQTSFSDAENFIGKVIDLLIKMVGVVALVFLVIGGFRLVVAAGNDNEIQKAKSMIQYSITGLVVALLAYLIVAAVQGILYR